MHRVEEGKEGRPLDAFLQHPPDDAVLLLSSPKSPSPTSQRGRKTASRTSFRMAGRKAATVRTHFGASRVGRPFPVHLLHHKYIPNEFNDLLLPDPSHVQGAPALTVDLRFWADLATAMTLFFEHGIAVEELVFSGNLEADARLLHLASRLFADSLQALTLAGCPGIDLSALAYLNPLSRLHTLDLGDNLYLTDAHVEALLDRDLKVLRHVGLSGCPLLTDRALLAVSRQAGRVLSLNASNNSNFTHAGANAVALHCDALTSLELANCRRLTFVGVVMEAGASLFGRQELVQFAGRALTKLRLDNNAAMQEHALDWVCGALPDLEDVSLPRVRLLGDGMVQGLAYGCPGLRRLRIQGCRRVRTEALRALGLKARCLTELNAAGIGRVDASAVRDLLTHCPTLRALSLSHNKGVDDTVFSQLEAGKGRPVMLPNIRRLTLADTALTSFGVACLAERCPGLEHLDVSGHALVTDAALLVVAACCTGLRSLWLNDCPALSDRAVVAVCRACRRLEVLHLSTSVRDTDAWGGRVQQYTDAVLEACLDQSRGLRELSLRNQCALRLSSPWLASGLAQRGGHTFLEKVDLRGSDALSLDCLAAVLRQCSVLSLVLLSDEAALPGVRGAEFWNKAFRSSMYTAPHCPAPADVTAEDERGRYCDDDGSASFDGSLGLASAPGPFDPSRSLDTLGTLGASLDGSWGDGQGSAPGPGPGLGQGSMLTEASVASGVSRATLGTAAASPSPSLSASLSAKKAKKAKGKALSLAEHSTDTGGAAPRLPSGFLALSGHPNRRALQYRDQYFRRRHDEMHAARVIQVKYRVHAIWQRFRYRISARKIAHTYHLVLRRRVLMARVREMQLFYSARAIQRYFKHCMLPFLRAATLIQKMYRGRYAKKRIRILLKGGRAAVLIQRVARGMLVRVSERYILAQIYLKLPPFWRLIVGMAPPQDRGEEAARRRLFPYQLSELRQTTASLAEHLLMDVSGGVLAPRLAQYIPQPFDKAPYVSGGDGRKLAFYGHREGLLWTDTEKTTERMQEKAARRKRQLQYDAQGMDVHRAAARERALALREGGAGGAKQERQSVLAALVDGAERVPLHQFNVTFWPHTAPLHFEDPSIEQHDPMVSGFDVATNSRTVLYCETCRARLRIIRCQTCQKGYCFFCAFRSHTALTRRNHQMVMMEPRVVMVSEPSKSLLFHVDLAHQACYDLKYLVKFMRSATETKRVQAEARLAKEFEKAEEARRMVFLRAQGESNDRHAAATEISLLYRGLKARRVVAEKRLQLAIEAETVQHARMAGLLIPAQRLFRKFSTRLWFAQRGQVFKLFRARPKKRRMRLKGEAPAIPFADTAARAAYEVQQRRASARSAQMETLLDRYGTCLAFLETNIAHWREMDARLPPVIARLDEVRDRRSAEHDKESQTTAALKATLPPHEYELLEKQLEALWVRVEIAQQRQHNVNNIRWWIAQHLRSCVRRREIVRARLQDTLRRLEWVATEFALVQRVDAQSRVRIDAYRPQLGMGMAAEWLGRLRGHCAMHLASLDALQETVLLEESGRLSRDEGQGLELDSLMEELFQGLQEENRLLAEKVDLEVRQRDAALEPGSAEAVRVSEGLVLVKRKQGQLAASVLDALRLGLQNKFNEEEDRYVPLYAFPGDGPDLPVERFDEITAELVEPYKAPHHVKMHEFLQCYLVQPWLAELAVQDVRCEEGLTLQAIEAGKVQEELSGLLLKLQDNANKDAENRRIIQESGLELAARLAAEADPNEDDDEAAERLAAVNRLQGEVFKRESENEVMEVLTAKMRLGEEPLRLRIAAMHQAAADEERALQERRDERERRSALFFRAELGVQAGLLLELAGAQQRVDADLAALGKRQAVHRAGCESDEFVSRVAAGQASVVEREAMRVPLGSRRFALQDCLHASHPRVSAPAALLLRRLAEGRAHASASSLAALAATKARLQAEEEELEGFPARVGRYEKAVVLFREHLLQQRRQKAMQRELVLRKRRLEELRATRLRAMREVKEAAEEAVRAKDEEREAARRNHVPLRKRIAKVTKQAVRDARDLVTELQHAAGTYMDPEELRMAARLRAKASDDALKPQAVRKLYLTHGAADDEDFRRQQEVLQERGVPFYTKAVARTIGNQLFLWAQDTFDNKLMLTNLELAHKQAGHALFRDPEAMAKDGWTAVTHESTDLVFFVKADVTKLRALRSLDVSLSELEENRHLVDGLEPLDPKLSEFGLPDVTLWWKRAEKLRSSASESTNDVINEVIKTRALLKSNPGDRNMQALVGRLNDKLRGAYEKEKKLLVQDPLKAAVDMMVLTAPELEAWMDVFGKVDRQKEGAVSFEDVFVFLEETPTAYAKEVFYSVDAPDEKGLIEFGDFVRAVQTYCMLGKGELLKFLFVFADKDKAGVITHSQFVTLLNVLNPFDKRRAKTALAEMDLSPDREMKYAEFALTHDRFPNIMHPAFRLQDKMRSKIMGVDWWFDKLTKYRAVRRKMQQGGANVDLMAEIQMARFEGDRQKERRMKEREHAIRNEANPIRKALMEARQFVDEFT